MYAYAPHPMKRDLFSEEPNLTADPIRAGFSQPVPSVAWRVASSSIYYARSGAPLSAVGNGCRDVSPIVPGRHDRAGVTIPLLRRPRPTRPGKGARLDSESARKKGQLTLKHGKTDKWF